MLARIRDLRVTLKQNLLVLVGKSIQNNMVNL